MIKLSARLLKQHVVTDVAIVGGGIVGLATARELALRDPKLSITVIEKEKSIASHQSRRNSGVMHAGIYYPPESMRAKLCVQGVRELAEYCDKRNVPYKLVGKLIVAVEEEEVPRLQALYERGKLNGVPGLQLLERADDILNIEPRLNKDVLMAIWSPMTGIIDYTQVAESYAADLGALSSDLRSTSILTGFEAGAFLTNPDGSTTIQNGKTDSTTSIVTARAVVTCCGLQSDLVARESGGIQQPSIVPVRGSYLQLREQYRSMVTTNVYPVPNPAFPWLGVHFTPLMNGRVVIGPNAVLALKREGYSRTSFDFEQLKRSVQDEGLLRLMLNNVSYGIKEMAKDLVPSLVLPELQKYYPELTSAHLEAYDTHGVRALALHESGELVEDFVFESIENTSGCILNVRNAPSPAATSSLAIARAIADKLHSMEKFAFQS